MTSGPVAAIFEGMARWSLSLVAAVVLLAALAGTVAAPAGPTPFQLRPSTRPGGFDTRGQILEIASDGPRVAALVDGSAVDCALPVGWNASTRRLVRFAYRPDGGCGLIELLAQLSLRGSVMRWKAFFDSGMGQPELQTWTANMSTGVMREVDAVVTDQGYPEHPAPGTVTRRGVSFEFSNGTILLRRLADSAERRLHPGRGAVDGELEDTGLFYAYNTTGRAPGHVRFLPFAMLFP